ncbi:MAG: DNA methyltransferase [Bacillota bacterium]
MKIEIDKIKFIKDIYPRAEIDNTTVNRYRTAIDKLPKIVITKNFELIDGYHRLVAHKIEGRKEIEVEIRDVKDPLIEAIKLNSTHGFQLSIDDKKRLSEKLYREKRLNEKEVAELLSVSQPTISNWLKDVVKEVKERQKEEIYNLWLNCRTQEEIAERVGLTQKRISEILTDIRNINSNKLYIPSNLQLYNVWKVFSLDEEQLKYPGQLPLDLVENIVYYYSEPFDVVLDPMAGSGVTKTACKNLHRRYLLYDISPIREDINIEKNDVLSGFPERVSKFHPSLIILDPPYYSLKKEYVQNEFNKSYSSFLNAMKITLSNCLKVLKKNGKIALILKPMNEKLFEGDWYDMTIDCVNIAKKVRLNLIKRIVAPLSTQQFDKPAQEITTAKEKKAMLNILRDIVIFES